MTIYGLKYIMRRGVDICIKPTTRCQLNCSYCSVNYTLGRRPIFSEIKWYEWAEIITAYPKKIRQVTISGGEPMIYSDLSELVDWLICNDYLVTIYTNLVGPKLRINFFRSRNLKIRATYHPHEVKINMFLDRLTWYKTCYRYIRVWEFKGLGNYLKKSDIRKLETEQSRAKSIVFAPDGREFDSCYEMEKAG